MTVDAKTLAHLKCGQLAVQVWGRRGAPGPSPVVPRGCPLSPGQSPSRCRWAHSPATIPRPHVRGCCRGNWLVEGLASRASCLVHRWRRDLPPRHLFRRLKANPLEVRPLPIGGAKFNLQTQGTICLQTALLLLGGTEGLFVSVPCQICWGGVDLGMDTNM